MDGKPIAVIHTQTGTIHILRLYLGTKFSGTAADKNPAKQKFSAGMKQIHAHITAAHIHFLHIHLNTALGATHINLGKADVFSFFPALIGIYVRNQSPIIRHSSHPLRDYSTLEVPSVHYYICGGNKSYVQNPYSVYLQFSVK